MTAASSIIGELLADCEVRGISLTPTEDRGLTIDAPQGALAPDLLARLKAHKAELLAQLQSTKIRPASTCEAPVKAAETVCRCGSTAWRDVPIHSGQSVRRDCERCEQFIDFPIWYGKGY